MKLFILNLIPIVVIAAASIYFCIITAVNRYVPEIKVTVSEDGGKTYTGSLKSIPKGKDIKDIYIKCEVSVKANGLLWRFLPRIIEFPIEYPNGFELCDYTGPQKTAKDKSKEADKEAKETFFVAASNKPKKTEIIFKLPKANNTIETCALIFSFDLPIFKKVYNKTVTLDFIPSSEPAAADSAKKLYPEISVSFSMNMQNQNTIDGENAVPDK
ncbi:MAG: hypothetical protein LBP80_04335 [Treponema sp.]|jgi:hypothetical protein|nr:hypothetical protein [Treponema sp.]